MAQGEEKEGEKMTLSADIKAVDEWRKKLYQIWNGHIDKLKEEFWESIKTLLPFNFEVYTKWGWSSQKMSFGYYDSKCEHLTLALGHCVDPIRIGGLGQYESFPRWIGYQVIRRGMLAEIRRRSKDKQKEAKKLMERVEDVLVK